MRRRVKGQARKIVMSKSDTNARFLRFCAVFDYSPRSAASMAKFREFERSIVPLFDNPEKLRQLVDGGRSDRREEGRGKLRQGFAILVAVVVQAAQHYGLSQ